VENDNPVVIMFSESHLRGRRSDHYAIGGRQ
jgi:hypothetical protein